MSRESIHTTIPEYQKEFLEDTGIKASHLLQEAINRKITFYEWMPPEQLSKKKKEAGLD